MKKIEHIGIAVKNLAEANQLYSTLLNTKPYKEEAVESEGVTTSFFEVGESKIELLAATREDSAIAKYIEKRGEGIHHIAFYVDNIENEIKRLQQEGFVLLNDQPKIGADNKKIAFLHPKSANGVLVELCEDINN
ncbi:methylmalonyl-CoA epimerase [Mesonia sp.]|uniref:methylmalonyl-CoA epimerase n=1 Tax=Mesonia sp. TaxID=1960830 RepID=UPI001765D6F6|nr:methylmalonyl-CoA epimerase [Mesonia sp.]HIB37270.1 methylmalonyl-CoA epimerase [Mesonia sp.]